LVGLRSDDQSSSYSNEPAAGKHPRLLRHRPGYYPLLLLAVVQLLYVKLLTLASNIHKKEKKSELLHDDDQQACELSTPGVCAV
jgi:hypothetical protein